MSATLIIHTVLLYLLLVQDGASTNCPSESEIVVLMDESGSITASGFQKMKEFVAALVLDFDVGPNRFSVTTFGSEPTFQFGLSWYSDKSVLRSVILNLPFANGGTDIEAALRHVRQLSFNDARPGVPKILLLITDGQSSGNIIGEADLLKNMGVIIYCIGVGSGVNEALLRSISTDYYYTTIVNSTNLLLDIKDQTAHSTCSQGQCTSTTCGINGWCKQHATHYICKCKTGYHGRFCEDLCQTKPAELVFLVDASLSTSAEWFAKQLNFVENIVRNLTFADYRFNVSVITYSHKAYLDIEFGSYHNNSDLLKRIENISHKNGSTNVKDACNMAKGVLKSTTDVAQFVFLLTDGMPSNIHDAEVGVTELRRHLRTVHPRNKLHLISTGHDVRPEGIAALSKDRLYYKDIFTTLNEDVLLETIRDLEDPKCKACSPTYKDETDLVFLIDVGSQQPYKTFMLQTNVLGRFVHKLNILKLGEAHTQIAAITFSSDIQQTLWLNSTYDAVEISSFMSGVTMDRKNSSSDVAHALDYVGTEVFSERHGARPTSRKMVVFPVTGYDKDVQKTAIEIERLKTDGILILAVGVGKHFSDHLVLRFASDALFAVFADNDISDEYVRMFLKHTSYITSPSRFNS